MFPYYAKLWKEHNDNTALQAWLRRCETQCTIIEAGGLYVLGTEGCQILLIICRNIELLYISRLV
jgi:hypothetical protein